MKRQAAPPLLAFFLSAVPLMFAVSSAHAADLQAKTIDGQVIQGEYLGTEDNVVKLKTNYGVVSIPSKNIVTLLAINSPDKKAPGTGSPKDADVPEEVLVFKEPKTVNITSLLAARMPRIPDPDVRSRLELFRCVRNFGASSDASRQRIVRTLANYGLMAYPFIDSSYTDPMDLPDKVELVQAITGPRKPFTTQIFLTVHATALSEISRSASQPPQAPDDYISKRPSTPTREQRLKNVARDIRTLEGYASACGGPFNALFLFGIYKTRYGGDSDALLKNLPSDRARLTAAVADCKNSDAGWTPEDRVVLIESAFPLYFKDNEDLKSVAEVLLKKLLPDSHPKWDATQAEWVRWWSKQHNEILKTKK